MAAASIPAVFSLGLFALIPILGIRIFAFDGVYTSDSGACFFLSTFLVTLVLAWRFFLLFCFLESKASPQERGLVKCRGEKTCPAPD
jgi:hypothetical protein